MIILGMGCNIGDRLGGLRKALNRIQEISEIKVHKVSPIYESDALLLPDSPETWNKPFLNLAIGISTNLEPLELLNKIKSVEKVMGRDSSVKWSPRIIDIDILTWDDKHIKLDGLTIPHPDLLGRPFALLPLADIDPGWKYCVDGKKETGMFARDVIKKFGSRFDGKAPLKTRQINHRVDTPIMMGILNITPDSFSDGGKFFDCEKALEQAKRLFDDGADIIDIGAESTRPGSTILSLEEEWSRLKPILDEWTSFWGNADFKPKLSVDTCKPETAAKLLSYNVDFINDVSGLLNPKMQDIVKSSSAKIIFMHNLLIPANSDIVFPPGVDVVSKVYEWGKKQLDNLIKIGIDKDRLIFDVGIGFGKDMGQSSALIKNIKKFHDLDLPILVGHSRKSFLNQFTDKDFSKRDLETAAISEFLFNEGVDYLRVHNIEQNMRLLKINRTLCDLN